MRRLWLLAFLAWSGLLLLGGPAAAAAPDLRFKVIELGLPAGITEAQADGLNNHNPAAVVGHGSTSDYKTRAILWDQSQDVGTLLPLLAGYDQSQAYAINDAGQVVGNCFNYSTNGWQACVWHQGAVQALEPPTGLGPVSYTLSYGINNQGQVAGEARLVNANGDYPMLWDHGPAQPLESPPANTGLAHFISNNGVVAGFYANNSLSFLWTKAGGFITINGGIQGINGLGQTVGYNDSFQPCQWNSQGVATLLDGLQSGSANAINDLGQIVGLGLTVGGAAQSNFLWQAGQVTDLGKVLLGYDWQLVSPVGINNAMEIAVTARRTDSVTLNRVVLLQPITSRPRFRLTDLGPNLIANGINDRGQIVGNPAFLWQGGQLKSLPGGATAYAINNVGKIVGSGFIGGVQTAVSWDLQGNMTPLEKSGGRSGEAFAVNFSGMAAGRAQNGSNNSPCIWNPDGTIQFLTSNEGVGRSITNNNLVVGSYYPSDNSSPLAFACTVGGGFLDLLPGTAYSIAFAVNSSGQAVGTYKQTANSAVLPFLWKGGQSQNLTFLQGAGGGINFLGQVVGWANSLYGGSHFGFLWDPDLNLMNLNELVIPPQPDWNLTVATGINMSMQIIGTGKYQGVDHAFLLDRVGNTMAEVNLLLLD